MKRLLTQIAQIALINFALFLLLVYYLGLVERSRITPRVPSPAGSPSVSAITPTAVPDNWAQLSRHNTPDDCWIAVEGHIYDITRFFGSHPGGDRDLASSCGKDATLGFQSKDRNPAMDHSASARALLKDFLIQ